MKVSPVIAALLVVTTLVPAGVVGSVNEPPLPDAGLDQTVQRSSEVFLDGTGSRDPDGRIVTHEWTITTPDGRTVTPTNDSNPRASFDAALRGRYAVSLTVTDDDGASRTDTMYVTVERGRRPTVHVSGPETPTAGSERTYTATFDRGAAPLDRIVWEVDGVRVANDSLTPAQSSASFSQMFGTTGTHTVSATVTDTDGLNASASHRLTVRSISTDASDSEPTASGASRHSPTVDGSRLVTGERPLSETYRLRNVPSSAVRSVTWRTEQGTIATGRAASVRWNPGDHTLFAVVRYTDGSRDVARFPNGGTDVTADPQPSVSLENLVTSGRLAGDALATDGYDNLQSVDVELDGEPLTRWPRNLVDTGKRLTGKRRVSFTKQVETGSETTLTVTATDHRGQRVTVSKQLSPTGTPEIVESGFVNTPVDSYHERIDPDRYVAKHVMKVDLNGVDPGNVSVDGRYGESNQVHLIQSSRYDRRVEYDHLNDVLTITDYWKSRYPGRYPIKYEVGSNKVEPRISMSNLSVEKSPPELRLNITDSGTVNPRSEWGLIIDAGSSFDPDGTDLKYVWTRGAEPVSSDNETAKFDSVKRATLVVRDQDNQTASRSHSFHQFFAPRIHEIQKVNEEPRQPNETVTFAIQTEKYRFTKTTYQIQLDTKVIGIDADVVRWEKIREVHANELTDTYYWKGIVEVPASQLRGEPEAVFEVYNEENPNRIKHRKQFPSVSVPTNATPVRRNLSVSNLRYLVERPRVQRQQVDTVQERNQLLRRGYNLTDTRITGTKQVIERRVKVRDAQYRTETEVFRRASRRNLFVEQSPDWNAGGSERVIETVPATETEWRSSRHGDGKFTGKTRQKRTDSADYQRWHEYEYEKEVTREGTRTDWESRTRTVEETRTRDVRRCTRFGCFEYEREYTVEVQKSYRVPVTEVYTYTTTETETYWGLRPRRSGHDSTGNSRLVKVDSADYTTQYQYRVETTRERTYRLYEATRKVQTKPPQYEWRHDQTRTGRINSYRITRDPDLRVASTTTSKEWTLVKNQGSSKVISESFNEEENVIETRATVSGVVVERLFYPKSGTFITTSQSEFTETRKRSGISGRSDFFSEGDSQDLRCNVRNRNHPSCGGYYN